MKNTSEYKDTGEGSTKLHGKIQQKNILLAEFKISFIRHHCSYPFKNYNNNF